MIRRAGFGQPRFADSVVPWGGGSPCCVTAIYLARVEMQVTQHGPFTLKPMTLDCGEPAQGPKTSVSSRIRIACIPARRKGEERVDDFIAVEDGQTFLSQDELDTYRTQQVQMAYEEGSDG